jgi:alanine dehydrogenase
LLENPMTLILNNDEIERVFTLDECFDVLEPALRDLGNGIAVNMPRQDLLVPGPLDGTYHGLKTSCASLPRLGVTTMRLTSDILTWPIVGGRQRRVKVPLVMGGKYVGLVFVFSTTTGELLAILADGFIQAIRVGVTNALSAKYMARPDSSVLAVYGSGWQARPAVLAMCKVLPVREVRIYSPTQSNRENFAGEMQRIISADIVAVSSPEEAAKDADVVALTTNALDPFFSACFDTRSCSAIHVTRAGERGSGIWQGRLRPHRARENRRRLARQTRAIRDNCRQSQRPG